MIPCELLILTKCVDNTENKYFIAQDWKEMGGNGE